MTTSLADTVLPLIRTRADVYRYSAANQHGGQMHDAIDILEAAIPTTDPAEVHTITHKALTSAIKVIARADDSAGIIGDACRRLLELHPRTAAAARVPSAKLIDWMITFQFGDGEVDYFELDPVAYAPALGETGVLAYRRRLAEIERGLGERPSDDDQWSSAHSHEWFTLAWNARRLAVLDHDIDAIIRTHARDRKVAAWLEDTAEAFEEIGEIELAIDWARQATDFGHGHQSRKAADYWCRLLQEHRPDDVTGARLAVFRKWPSSTTAAYLHEAAGESWPGYADEVHSTLTASPRDAVIFVLFTLKDAPQAWNLAHTLELDDGGTWAELVKVYEKIDPIATLPIHRGLVLGGLTAANAQLYRLAARRLAKMITLSTGTEHASEVREFIAELRQTHRRRPRLQQEFDQAGLP